MTLRWFNPPRLHVGATEEHRKATWLELFFDLVFVATVIELGDFLSDNTTLEGFVGVVFLFVPIWWSWVGTTVYSNRFDSDDLIHRLLVFLQIFAIAGMAINVYDGLGETSATFAFWYAMVRFVLVLMYIRVQRHVPEAWGLSSRYIIGFSIAAFFWLFSIVVPPPFRFILWMIGMVIDFATPTSPNSLALQRRLPPSPHHLPERFGLFTIIVLGETLLKIVSGATGEEITILSNLLGGTALVMLASMWWIYFGNYPEKVEWTSGSAGLWLYSHLPLHLGLMSMGVGIKKFVFIHEPHSPDNYRLLLGGAIALVLLALALIELNAFSRRELFRGRVQAVSHVISATFILVMIFISHDWHPLLFTAIIAGICAFQVVLNIYLRQRYPEPAEEGELSEI